MFLQFSHAVDIVKKSRSLFGNGQSLHAFSLTTFYSFCHYNSYKNYEFPDVPYCVPRSPCDCQAQPVELGLGHAEPSPALNCVVAPVDLRHLCQESTVARFRLAHVQPLLNLPSLGNSRVKDRHLEVLFQRLNDVEDA